MRATLHPWNTGEEPDLFGVSEMVERYDKRLARLREAETAFIKDRTVTRHVVVDGNGDVLGEFTGPDSKVQARKLMFERRWLFFRRPVNLDGALFAHNAAGEVVGNWRHDRGLDRNSL